jgi:uncharacterized RDD family membrane protein YckC
MAELQPPLYAPLWRRLAAVAYDALLLLALFVGVLFAEVLVRDALGLPPSYALLRALLLLVIIGFYGWFWTHGGQTLGMRAWRLQLRRTDGRPLRWPDVLARVGVGCLSWGLGGLGMLWCLVDPRRRAWHDIATGTETIVLQKD